MKNVIAATAFCLGFSVFMSFPASAKVGKVTENASNQTVVSIISDAAKRNGVPVAFALGIAMQESGFRSHVTSSASAIGLFQIKCATAKGIGYRGSCRGLYDPAVNAQWGTRHLALGLRKCKSLAGAAKLHNAGLGATCTASGYSRSVMKLTAKFS
jgi:soluble lytic murein transglycosylase-like protein